MHVVIVGYGFVGKALRSVLRDATSTRATNLRLSIVDPALESSEKFEDVVSTNPDIVFLCLPTPTTGGHCDDTLVMDYIQKLRSYPGLVVVKSTVPVSTVENILLHRPTTVFWPELLRESKAAEDMKNPKIIVIGAPSNLQASYLTRFIEAYTTIAVPNSASVKVVSPKESSIFKYAINSFLATKVVFMHQMFSWLKERGDGESYSVLVELMKAEGRSGQTHFDAPGQHGLGFAGSCFPKDTAALLSQVKNDDDQEFGLLEAVIEENEKLRS